MFVWQAKKLEKNHHYFSLNFQVFLWVIIIWWWWFFEVKGDIFNVFLAKWNKDKWSFLKEFSFVKQTFDYHHCLPYSLHSSFQIFNDDNDDKQTNKWLVVVIIITGEIFLKNVFVFWFMKIDSIHRSQT